MQPLQCVLQHHVHIHAAVTVRFAPGRCRTQSRNRLRVNMATAGCSHYTPKNTKFRAPVSSPQQTPCNIHAAFTLRFAAPRAHWCSHYNAICIHALQNTSEHHGRTDDASKRAHPQLPRTRAALHRLPLYTEKHNVWCSGFLPKT